MEPFALYLFKSAIWLTGFAVIYFLFLRNERFFLLKRYYLVSGILISLIFPLISVHYQVTLPASPVTPVISLPVETNDHSSVQLIAPARHFNSHYILLLLYMSGLLFFALRMIYNLRSLYKRITRLDFSIRGKVRLIRAPEFSTSFSFFNYVFVNPSVCDAELKEIMNHELVHVRQKHWFDLLLAELFRLLQWANPFAWIYTKFIRLNHENIADEAALQSTSDPALYKAALLNQIFKSPVISLSNSFNYSLNNNRFDMMKKVFISPYRKLKLLFVIPVFGIVFYAFAIPDYHYVTTSLLPVTNNQAPVIIQKVVRGIVSNEEGKPLEGVNIMSTGTMGNAFAATTGSDGRFTINNVQENAYLLIAFRGYKGVSLKAVFDSEMTIKLEKDPAYKAKPQEIKIKYLIVVDDVITDTLPERNKIASVKILKDKEAIDKYGEKGKNGVMEYMTLKRAAELGIKIPFRRRNPEDFPTFQGERFSAFTNWIINKLKYPPEAQAKGIQGWAHVSFTIEKDGSITNVRPTGPTNPLLGDAIVKVINSAPKWEPAKNPEATEPYTSEVTLKFELPDKILNEPPFVVVAEMPEYPGGDSLLLDFIAINIVYPEQAKSEKIEGKVIARFIVSKDGKAEDATILKGVNPLLDAEALRVVNMLKGFKPGMQDGKPVNVWYMVPVNFKLQ